MISIRLWARKSSLVTRVIHFFLKFGLTDRLILKLGMVYLQSESLKLHQIEVLKKTIKAVSLGRTESLLRLSKSAIIKAPTNAEKGVLIVGFEHELDKIVHSESFDQVCDAYDVLFMPTWQPFYSDELLRFLKKRPESLTILPSSWQCYFQAIQYSELLQVLPFHASSWIDERIYQPADKDIDILMVANFAIYKRHALLFEALQKLPEYLKVVLVGRPLKSRTYDDLMAEASTYGVSHRFELIEAPSDDEVRDYLCRAKLVLGLSGREGSYVSLAEALFADAGVAVFSNAVIGTKNYITPETGFLLQQDRPLSDQIERCLSLLPTLTPRSWAIRNISAAVNGEKLNRLLKHKALADGGQWTRNCDLFRIQSFQFEPMSGSWSDTVLSAANELHKNGITLKAQN